MTSLKLRIQLPRVSGANGEVSRFTPIIMALECLTQINQWHFRRGDCPPLFSTGVRYRQEAPGQEDWNDAPTIATMGYGDCEDLAAYYCAELRELHGLKDARCVIKQKYFSPEEIRKSGYPIVSSKGMYLIHCLVQLPDGTVFDPSKELGMKGEY